MRRAKIFSLCIALMIAVCLCFTACGGGGGGGEDGDARTLTIYRARSTGMVDGTEDAAVKKAIEDKFYQDTGIKINLNVKMYSDDELNTKVDNDWTKKSADMDAVIHYIGEDSGSSIKKYAIAQDTVLEVKSLLEQYGQNILKYIRQGDTGHIGERSGYVSYGDGTYSMNIVPGVEAEQGYAMLVRKDFMKEVQQYTGLDPEDFDVTNDDYRSMTITEFNSFLTACKQHITDIRYPISGKAWDLNRVLGPVFDCDAYTVQIGTDGKYAPAQFAQGTADFMQQIWEWAKNGIWEAESASMPDQTRLQNFMAGFSAVYCTYPQIENLISVARKVNANDPNAELMVIAPLAKDDGTVNGYLKMQRAFSGMILPLKSDDAALMIQYVDWLYSDPDNYELAKYGIKGEHWVDGEDYVSGGKTYKTWVYPDGKEDQFNENPPYSGLYAILPNINVSNLIRGDYNTTEKYWYVMATQEFPVWHSQTEEGIWLSETPRALRNQANNVDGDFVENIRGICWSGLGDTDITELLADYVVKERANAKDYLDFVDSDIRASIEYFNQLFNS